MWSFTVFFVFFSYIFIFKYKCCFLLMYIICCHTSVKIVKCSYWVLFILRLFGMLLYCSSFSLNYCRLWPIVLCVVLEQAYTFGQLSEEKLVVCSCKLSPNRAQRLGWCGFQWSVLKLGAAAWVFQPTSALPPFTYSHIHFSAMRKLKIETAQIARSPCRRLLASPPTLTSSGCNSI